MISQQIIKKFKEREALRQQGNFSQADKIRAELETFGVKIVDKPDGTSGIVDVTEKQVSATIEPATLTVFGSGEIASTGRKIHELIIQKFHPPIRISLLETPAGFQDNPHNWYQKLKEKLTLGLKNYSPEITLIPALDKNDVNNAAILEPLLHANYIHTGAGSPSYALRTLQDSLALKIIRERFAAGIPFSTASAATIAFGKYALPVYEIYFAGNDPYWLTGLDYFSQWNLNISFIPHWNNHEGGKNIDTRFSYMGERRFNKLLTLLPGPTTLIGIDEHTALVFEPFRQMVKVLGKGTITVIKNTETRIYKKGDQFSFQNLSII